MSGLVFAVLLLLVLALVLGAVWVLMDRRRSWKLHRNGSLAPASSALERSTEDLAAKAAVRNVARELSEHGPTPVEAIRQHSSAKAGAAARRRQVTREQLPWRVWCAATARSYLFASPRMLFDLADWHQEHGRPFENEAMAPKALRPSIDVVRRWLREDLGGAGWVRLKVPGSYTAVWMDPRAEALGVGPIAEAMGKDLRGGRA